MDTILIPHSMQILYLIPCRKVIIHTTMKLHGINPINLSWLREILKVKSMTFGVCI